MAGEKLTEPTLSGTETAHAGCSRLDHAMEDDNGLLEILVYKRTRQRPLLWESRP